MLPVVMDIRLKIVQQTVSFGKEATEMKFLKEVLNDSVFKACLRRSPSDSDS